MGRSGHGSSGLYSQVDLRDWIEQDRRTLLAYITAAQQAAGRARKELLRKA